MPITVGKGKSHLVGKGMSHVAGKFTSEEATHIYFLYEALKRKEPEAPEIIYCQR